MIWELVTGEVPVRGQLQQIRSPEECPQAVSQLIDDCLRDKPSDRPTAHDVVLRLGGSREGPRRARPREAPAGRKPDPKILVEDGGENFGDRRAAELESAVAESLAAAETSAATEKGVLRLGVFALPEAAEGSD